SVPIVTVLSPAPAIRRSLMPVRDRIHSSLVSTVRATSLLVITLAGTYEPHPVMAAFCAGMAVRSFGNAGPSPRPYLDRYGTDCGKASSGDCLWTRSRCGHRFRDCESPEQSLKIVQTAGRLF